MTAMAKIMATFMLATTNLGTVLSAPTPSPSKSNWELPTNLTAEIPLFRPHSQTPEPTANQLFKQMEENERMHQIDLNPHSPRHPPTKTCSTESLKDNDRLPQRKAHRRAGALFFAHLSENPGKEGSQQRLPPDGHARQEGQGRATRKTARAERAEHTTDSQEEKEKAEPRCEGSQEGQANRPSWS